MRGTPPATALPTITLWVSVTGFHAMHDVNDTIDTIQNAKQPGVQMDAGLSCVRLATS